MSNRISTLRELERAAPRESAHLYAIAGLWTRRVKIGKAADPYQRWDQLQRGSGEELLILATASHIGHLERAIHDVFDEHRLHGEWFDPSVTALIVEAVPLSILGARRDALFTDFVRSSIREHRTSIIDEMARATRELDEETFEWRGRQRPL